jgi:hypothetical protein
LHLSDPVEALSRIMRVRVGAPREAERICPNSEHLDYPIQHTASRNRLIQFCAFPQCSQVYAVDDSNVGIKGFCQTTRDTCSNTANMQIISD